MQFHTFLALIAVSVSAQGISLSFLRRSSSSGGSLRSRPPTPDRHPGDTPPNEPIGSSGHGSAYDPSASVDTSKFGKAEIPMDEIFDIQLKSKGDKWGTCDQWFQAQSRPGSPEPGSKDPGAGYDYSNQPAQKPLKPLNLMWHHAALLQKAGQAINENKNLNMETHSGGLAGDEATAEQNRRLLGKAFFGISEKGQLGALDQARRKQIEHAFATVGIDFFDGGVASKGKIPLFCGSEWLSYMEGTSPMKLTPQGQWASTSSAGHGTKSLRDVMMQNWGYKDFDQNWYFLPEAVPGFQRVPIKMNKAGFPQRSDGKPPFGVLTSEHNRPDPCVNQKSGGYVINLPTTAGKSQPVAIICPAAFERFPKTQDHIGVGVRASNSLDEFGVNGLTLFRLLVVLAYNQSIRPQSKFHGPSAAIKGHLKSVPQWYLQKSNWAIDESRMAETAIDAMYLALYDTATPASQNLQPQMSIWTAENYGWFALAAYLNAETDFDWSTGVARKKGLPWQVPVLPAV